MAKSKRKSGSSTDVSRWETELAQASLMEDDWKTVVVFAVPNQIEDVKHCHVLSESISTGLRKLFSVIEYDALVKEVKDLAHGKAGKVKTSKPPPFVEIVDSIKSLVEQGEDIPPVLLAKLIKFKMLMIKQKDLDRREEEKKAAETAAKQAKQEERSRSKMGSSPGKRSKSQSPGRKKGKRDDAPPSPKKDTKLKRRGELEDTFKTIDDEPDGADDPQHYIIITSVYECRVLQPLIDLGVVVDAILNVKSEAYPSIEERLKAQQQQQEIEHDADEDAKEVNPNDEEEKRNEQKVKEKLQTFWGNVENVIKSSPSGTKIKDIANLSVIVKNAVVPPEDLKVMEQEKKTEYGTKMFEYTANVCYDLLDSKKRYKRYINNLKLTHVPSLRETILSCKSQTGFDPTSAERQTNIPNIDMRYYNHLMDQVPSEAHSVPLMLDSLLKQVEATVDQKDPMDEPIPARDDNLEHSLGDYLDVKLKQLGLKDPETKSNNSREGQNGPIILHHGDDRSLRLHHLNKIKDFSPQDAEQRVYDCHHLKSLINHSLINHDQSNSDRKSISTRKQQLAHFCNASRDQASFDKLLTLMSLEVLPLRTVAIDGEVSDQIDHPFDAHIGWDDPYTFDCITDQDQKQQSENDYDNIRDIEILRNLSQHRFSEYFDPAVFPQVLDEALALRPYMDVYYHRGLSHLLLVLHNPHDHQLKNRKSWDTWLHSNVGLRNYLEHVTDSVEAWQREMDAEEEIRNRPVTPETPPREPTPVPIKTNNRNNMITRAEMLEMKEAEDDKNKKKNRKSRSRSRSPGKRPPSGLKKTNSPDKREKTGSSLKRTPSARKPASRAGTARKNLKSSQEKKPDPQVTEEVKNADEIDKEYPFNGYDVGDELIHISGQTSYLFPRDGSLIKVETLDYVNGNKTKRTAVYKDDNLLVLNVKNPIMKSEEPVQMNETQQPTVDITKPEEPEQAEAEEDPEQGSEFAELLSTIPDIPALTEPRSEETYLTINFKDGMRLGIDSKTSTRLKDRFETLRTSIDGLKDSVKKLGTAGHVPSALNAKATSPKGKRNKEDELRRQEELEKQLEKETRGRIEEVIKDAYIARQVYLRTGNLSVSCPDGLQLTFVHDEVKKKDAENILIIRQEYILGGNGKHSCEEVRLKLMKEERARVITMEGTVIKYMADGSVKVLFPDGSVCTSPSFTPSKIPASESKLHEHADTSGVNNNEMNSMMKKPGNQLTLKPAVESTKENAVEWLLVNAAGERYRVESNSEESKLNDIIIYRATCPRTQQILETREDGVITVRRPDGTFIVEHNDGTRITKYFMVASQGRDHETGEEEIKKHESVEHIKVECLGYATVLINKSRQEIKAIFGDGSNIQAALNGEYEITKPDETKVFVNNKSETIFAPSGTMPDSGSYKVGSLMPLFDHIEINGIPPGAYMLKLADSNCLSTIDHSGNQFVVSHTGGISSQENQANEGDNSTDDSQLQPRYFVVQQDGSAEELLRLADFSQYLEQAKKDPQVAVIQPRADKEDGIGGTTILQPFKGTKSELWLKQNDEADIIPFDLKERDFKTLPSKELKSAGPIFGSNAGLAFQVATKPAPKSPRPLVHCPKVLEMRHIGQFSGLSTDERRKMIEGIEKYRKFVKEQDEREAGLLPVDPRSEEERMKSIELLEKFKEIETKSGETTMAKFDMNKIASDYIDATKAPPSPPPKRATPQRSLKEWEQDRIEVAELKYAKDYLRSGVVPPYFDTEEGQRFLNTTQIASDIERIAADLAKETVHPSYRPASEATTTSSGVTPDPSNMSNQSGEFYDLRKSDQPINGSLVDSSLFASPKPSPLESKLSLSRPGNPTPAEAVNGDSGLGMHRDVQSRSRPYNPTPHHALKNNSVTFTASFQERINEIPEAHSARKNDDSDFQRHVSEEDSNFQVVYSSEPNDSSAQGGQISIGPHEEGVSPQFAGLNYTVTGEPRAETVKLPASIRGSRAGALPNQKFKTVEEPVRRQVKTASVAGTVNPESTSQLRGFHLLPDSVDFGVLKEGLSYSQTVMLKNVGIDSCRFKIKQPPPSTGLKVIYNPGPVAAGMATRLDVEIFAVAVGVEGSSGIGSIGHHIEIITETDALYLPVVATILTAYEYDSRSDSSPRRGPSKNTILLSNRPSSRDALTRPRKI